MKIYRLLRDDKVKVRGLNPYAAAILRYLQKRRGNAAGDDMLTYSLFNGQKEKTDAGLRQLQKLGIVESI
jgi:hypothetical protein